jgi:hypothetical protein
MTPVPAGIHFEPLDHDYFLDGAPIPSVTEVLDEAGHGSDWRFLGVDRDWYLERGSAYHAAIALALRGALDVSTIDPEIEVFVRNALRFVRDLEIVPILVEARVACPILRVGGTLDLFGYSKKLGRHVLPDWKGVTYQRNMDLQVEGGYRTLLRSSVRHGLLPKGVEITLDQVRDARAGTVTLGGARAVPHWIDKPRLEAAVFAGACASYHWNHAAKKPLKQPLPKEAT